MYHSANLVGGDLCEQRLRRASRPQGLARRTLLQIGVTGAISIVTGRGGRDALGPIDVVGVPPAGPVPGFDDPHRWAGKTLRLGAWGGDVQDALRDAVWQPFADATGCAIEEVISDYGRLTDAVADGRSFADVILVDPFWAESASAQRLAQPLALGDDGAAAMGSFGGNESSVPAFAYALVGAYRRESIGADEPPRRWTDWWNVDRFPGPRALAREPFGTFEFALLADGVAPDHLYPLDIPRAIDGLKEISRRIVDRWWDSGLQPIAWLGTGRADLASSWHYRVRAGQLDGLGVDLEWAEGLVVADRWMVPVGAAEPEVATDFVRYALTPEVQAALARRIPLGPVVPDAIALLDGTVAATLPTAPSNLGRLIRPDLAWWVAHRGEATQRFNDWLLGSSTPR